MKSALIITSIVNDSIRIWRDSLDADYDMTICCDAGLDRAIELGVKPTILLGDFDSAEHFSMADDFDSAEHFSMADDFDDESDETETEADGAAEPDGENEDDVKAELVVLPHEKDVTDTEAAVDLAYERGATVITIIGGLGGRLDHTMANLGLLAKYLGKADIFIIDGDNFVRMLAPGKHMIVSAGYEYLGLIPFGGPVTGLTIKNVHYPLENCDVDGTTSLTVSNEITEDPAEISFESGKLLVIQSNDTIGHVI